MVDNSLLKLEESLKRDEFFINKAKKNNLKYDFVFFAQKEKEHFLVFQQCVNKILKIVQKAYLFNLISDLPIPNSLPLGKAGKDGEVIIVLPLKPYPYADFFNFFNYIAQEYNNSILPEFIFLEPHFADFENLMAYINFFKKIEEHKHNLTMD